MEKVIKLAGRGVIPCPHNVGEVHAHAGPPLPAEDLVVLLGRAMARHAQIGVAVENLRRILLEERVLAEEAPQLPMSLLEEVREALGVAQSVVPGAHQEALARITRALEQVDGYQERLPRRGLA
jgi:hypothetical protein